MAAAECSDGGEEVRGTVTEGKESDGGHAGGEAEVGSEAGDDWCEVVSGGTDKEIKVEEEN